MMWKWSSIRRDEDVDETMNDSTSAGSGIGPEQNETKSGRAQDLQRPEYSAEDDSLDVSDEPQHGEGNGGQNKDDVAPGYSSESTHGQSSRPFRQLGDPREQW